MCEGKTLLWVTVTLVLTVSAAQKRELSGIRYRLTTCGNAGRLGPASDRQCIDYHRNRGTLIARDDLILEQTESNFRGGQLVQIPRTTTYNLTVAGAAGGNGLCSPAFGRGIVVRAQAVLDENFEMLVLVGQRGMGPCELSEPPIDSICSSLRPANDSAQCNDTWWKYLETIGGSEAGFDVYRHAGGGGGGGASMIRLENDGGLQVFPLIVAGGGGGGAAVLDFRVLDSVSFTQPYNATTVEEIYQSFMDGKLEEFDPVLSNVRGGLGFVAPDAAVERSAGAGGGYASESESHRIDGSELIFEEAFAEGGTDCATSSFLPTSFTSEVGGFGAGGGGCGGGGGGGGYTGGTIVGTGNLVPGGGGYSFLQNSRQNPVQLLGYSWNDAGDGYIEMVAADCGCSYECRVYEAEDQFECMCTELSRLAPDLSDCYHSVNRSVRHNNLLVDPITGLMLTIVDFGSAVNLYSVTAALTSQLEEEGESGSGWSDLEAAERSDQSSGSSDVFCALVFIGENEDIVLVSNIAMGGQNTLTKLSRIEIDFNEGSLTIGDPTDFLQSPVGVTGALLVGLGDCFIMGELVLNISILGIQASSGVEVDGTKLEDEILANPERTTSLLLRVLQTNDTAPTVIDDTSPGAELTAWQIVLVGVAAALSFLALLTVAWLCIACYKRKTRKETKGMRVSRRSELQRSSLTSSLTTNAVYVSHRDSIFPQFPYNKINTQTPSPMEMRDRYSYSPGRNPNSFTRQHSGCGRVLWEEGTPEHNFPAFNRGRSRSTLRTSEWQYPRSQLIYMRELGEGQFGKVLLMKAQRGIAGFKRDLPVAVKTLTSRDPQKVAKFMEEAELTKKFSHPNIVSLLGVSTDDVLDDDNAPLMILEYMPYGDLHAFLENNKPGSEALSVSLGDDHFVSFATDVAEALKFIGEERFVHRDIAARNCLVGAGLRIKMADFGLAQRLNQSNCYLVEDGGVLPIRTMAPEIFLTGQFTISSDVWSYGVLLWEMVSYGALPLPGMTSRDIAEAAQTGTLHHTIPSCCPPVLGSLMTQCTTHHPNLWPSFTDILTQLTQHDP